MRSRHTRKISVITIYERQGGVTMTLKDLPIGKMATVLAVGGEGALRQHFLDMGIIPSAQVTMVKYAPHGRSSGGADT